jgi:Zn-dependent protease
VTPQTLTLGRLFDVRVGVHVSWLGVYAFMTIALARALGMLPLAQAYAFAGICALALFASVVAHELAHALVARRFGVRTNAITLFLLGGVATLDEEPRSPRADALIALAGPALSAALAAVALGALFVLDLLSRSGSLHDAAARLITYIVIANTVLALFNLIPAFPMDGGRVLRAVLWRVWSDRGAATNVAARVGIGFALLFAGGSVLVVAATHNIVYGWYLLLGAFLLRQCWSQERASQRRRPPNVRTAAVPCPSPSATIAGP